ncbi:MAG: SDR family NAD(P)-dependent oxidoreductase, partial [Gemmataceae bacterium]
MGCLFPGASDFSRFWTQIVQSADAIRDVPPSHWRPEDYLDPDPKKPDHVYTARGGFLDPVPFQPLAFGIPPGNLEATDASQLLGLLVAHQALSDCGYLDSQDSSRRGPRSMERTRVSVILGVTGTLQLVIPLGARLGHPIWRKALKEAGVADTVAEDVVQRIAEGYVPWQENSFPGLLGNVVAGRIANKFDLGGTNCVVDAACASSLSALHLAAMELATGKADLVLTGGVDTFNDIFMFTCFSKTPALSPTGNARPFDASGDGTVLGEGLGMVVLKRLDDARRDGDKILAVLRGIGTSSDGKGNAIYAPRKEGQIDALRDAYTKAGVESDTIELVEAHGTGTRVGDATEISALAEVYGTSKAGQPWCAIGSIKSQIGHTKAAAGVAGLIKAAAALHHKTLPPTIKVDQPLEVLRQPGCPIYVNTQKRPWMPSADHPRRAAVSAFGFGGSNFHAVLEEAEPTKQEIDWSGDVEILAFVGSSTDEIRSHIQRFPRDLSWSDCCRRARDSRRDWNPSAPVRLALVLARQRFDLGKTLERAGTILTSTAKTTAFPAEGIFFSTAKTPGKLAVLFPGQGSQYVGMMRDLICHFPQAFAVFSEAHQTLEREANQRLVDWVYPPPAFSEETRAAQEETLRATSAAQPALGAVSLAAWKVLRNFGVSADAFAGHSFGELTALCASGRVGEEDFYRLSILRGRMMAEAGQGRDAGAMLAVKATQEEITRILREAGIQLVLANKNAPSQTVLSGTEAEIGRAAEAFARNKIGTVRLPVSAAFHSPLVADAQKPFQQVLDGVTFAGRLPVYANTTASPYPDAADLARGLLAGQLAHPVEWVRLIQAMADSGIETFLEVGPGGRLAGLVEACLAGRPATVLTLDPTSGKRDGWFDLAACLANLAVLGYPVRLNDWHPLPDPAPTLSQGKAAFTVELSGVNYVQPRPARPAVAKAASPIPATVAAPVAPAAPPRPAVAKPVSSPPAVSPPAVASVTSERPRPVPHSQLSSSVPTSTPAASPVGNPTAITRALDVTRESLASLQRMQEQTAQLHRKFLEGQEQAHHTAHLLMEQQQRLLQASLGLPVSPFSEPRPVPVASTVPLSVSVPPTPALLAPPPPRPPATPPAPVPVQSPPPVRTAPEPPSKVAIPASTSVPPPVAPPVAAPVASSGDRDRVARVLLEVIGEKTGYPVEMLELGMTLDTDLGIDSIKRVEILAALQEKLPEAPVVKPEHLGTLHTLGDIAAFLANTAPSEGAASQPVAQDTSRVARVLLEVIGEKTGYPVEMLELGMTLDTDLGIDSIKRVEILAALQEKLPEAPVVKPEHLGTLHTLGDIATFLAGGSAGSNHHDSNGKASVVAAPSPAPVTTHRASEGTDTTTLDRTVVRVRSLPREDRPRLSLPAGAEIIITDENVTLAGRIAESLQERGFRPRLLPTRSLPEEGSPQGLILLAPHDGISDDWIRDALFAVQRVGSSLRVNRGLLIGVSCLDGSFGFGEAPPQREPLDGGIAGLVKTVRQEWPEVACKVIDLSPSTSSQESAAFIVEEMFLQGPMEVGMSSAGPVTLEREKEPFALGESPWNPGDVVLVSGGARGVTAEAAVALARAFRTTMVLLGRTSAPASADPVELERCGDEAELRREIARLHPGHAPRKVADEARTILASREIRRTLRRIEEAGGKAMYRSVDIRDAGSVRRVVDAIRQEVGPIRGIVHGAGVLADARIEDKTPSQFDEVYRTKIAGLRSLLAATEQDDLRALALFSSSTARFGRSGQVDYAIANEVLNKFGWWIASRRPECRVISLNWGPWDGGMVTPGLKQLFAREGVGVIPLQAGADLLVQELRQLFSGHRESVILAAGSSAPTGAPPAVPQLSPALPIAFERLLDPADHPFLNSHVIDGRPVLPTALILEWLAHAAMVQNP